MKYIYTSALIKAIYDERRDYLDTFAPLLLGVADENKFSTPGTLNKLVYKEFKIAIPVHLIRTVASRAQRKGYFKQQINPLAYKLTSEGRSYLGRLENRREVERRINSCIADIQNFFTEKGRLIDAAGVGDLLERFVKNNRASLVEFFNPKAKPEDLVENIKQSDENLLVEYLKAAEESKPEFYGVLQEMIYGSMISALLCAENASDITDTQDRGFKNVTAFLDSNLIFSILGFHSTETNLAAQELLELLKSFGFTLKVFDFTVDEICNVIGAYGQQRDLYYSDFSIDSIYRVLKSRGWQISNADEFIIGIEKILANYGIQIHNDSDIILKDYRSPYEGLRNRVYEFKQGQPQTSANHDLAAVEKVRKIRRGDVRRIEDAKAIFLTSDYLLHKADMIGMGHIENGTLGEVVLDRLLANVLWLKNPDVALPLQMIIAAHSRDLLINRHVWEKFYKILNQLRTEGKATDEGIATLFYKNHIEGALKEFSKRDVPRIDEKLVMDKIHEATDKFKDEKEGLISAKKQIEEELFKTQSVQEKEQSQHLQEITGIKANLRRAANKQAENTAKLMIFLIGAVFWFSLFFLARWAVQHINQTWLDSFNLIAGGSAITVVDGFLVWFLYPRIRDHLSQKYYTTKLYESGIL